MANIIIVLILVALVGYGIYSYVHHLTHGGGCCGERDAAAKKVKVEDHNKAHYPHTLVMGVDGMTCQNCQRHVENALRVVDFLVNHPKVERVNHPSLPENGYRPLYEKYFPRGGGSIFTFEIKGGAAEAQAFIDKLRIFSLLANVADVKSLAIHPASTTHSQMTPEELAQSGIRPNTIRLSIGTEHIDDILADLAAALEA